MQITVSLLHLLNLVLFSMNQREVGRVLLNYDQGTQSDINSLTANEQQVFDRISSQHSNITSGAISYQIVARKIHGNSGEDLTDLNQHRELAEHFLGDSPVYRTKRVIMDNPHESRRVLNDIEFDRREEKITSTYIFSEKVPKFMVISTSEVEGQPSVYYAIIKNNGQETTITTHIIDGVVYDAIATLNPEALKQRDSELEEKRIESGTQESSKGKKPAIRGQSRRDTAAITAEPYIDEDGVACYNHYAGFTLAGALQVGGEASLNVFVISFHNLIESTLEIQVGGRIIKFKLLGTKIYGADQTNIAGAYDAFGFARKLQRTIPGAHLVSMIFGNSEAQSGSQAGIAGVGGTFMYGLSSLPHLLTWMHELGHEFGAQHELAFCNAAWCTAVSQQAGVPIYSQLGKILYGNVIGDATHNNLEVIVAHIILRANRGAYVATVAPVVNHSLKPTALRTASPTIKGATNPPTYTQSPKLATGQSVEFTLNPDDNLRNLRLQFNDRVVEFVPVTNEITFPGTRDYLEGGGIIFKTTSGEVITDTRQFSPSDPRNLLIKLKRNVAVKFVIDVEDKAIKVYWYNDNRVKELIFQVRKQWFNLAPYISDPITIKSTTKHLQFDAVSGIGVTIPTQSPVKTPSPFAPTNLPSRMPAKNLTFKPSTRPTKVPTSKTGEPTSRAPTEAPTKTGAPSFAPTNLPSRMPAKNLTFKPSTRPTGAPTPKTGEPTSRRTTRSNTPLPSYVLTKRPTAAETRNPLAPPIPPNQTTAPTSSNTTNSEHTNDNNGAIAASAAVAGTSALALAAYYLANSSRKKKDKKAAKKAAKKTVSPLSSNPDSRGDGPARNEPRETPPPVPARDRIQRLELAQAQAQAQKNLVSQNTAKRKQGTILAPASDPAQSSEIKSATSVAERRKFFEDQTTSKTPGGRHGN